MTVTKRVSLGPHETKLLFSLESREADLFDLRTVQGILGDRSQRGVLKRALETRSELGYLGTSATKAQAERVLGDAARFLEWVRRALSLPEER